MATVAKIGAVLLALGVLALPSIYWLGSTVAYVGTALAVVGYGLLLWSRSHRATAAGLAAGGLDSNGTTEPPDVS